MALESSTRIPVRWAKSQPVWLEGGGWDRERFLAYAWLVVGLACIVTVYLDPELFGAHPRFGRVLCFTWFAYALVNLGVVFLRKERNPGWEFWSQAAGVTLSILIMTFSGGAYSPFQTLSVLLLLAAACRWGLNGTLMTAFVFIMYLFWLFLAPSSWPNRPAPMRSEPAIFNALISLLVVLGYFLGHLMEGEKRKFSDAVTISRLLRSALPGTSQRASIGNILRSVVEYVGADQARLTVQEVGRRRCYTWEARRPTDGGKATIQSWTSISPDRSTLLSIPSERACQLLGLKHLESGPSAGLPLADQVQPVKRRLSSPAARLQEPRHYYDELYNMHIISEWHAPTAGSGSMTVITVLFEETWLGCFTIYIPRHGRNGRETPEFLVALAHEVAPALYNKYLVARLRSRAQARERTRLAQELHDGIIQSLLGVEMQVALLHQKRKDPCQPSCVLQELGRLQELLHKEIANLREEMQRVKPLEVGPARLLESMAAMIDRFRLEGAIGANFYTQPQEISLPPRVCTELVRILQEALTNVRKHSKAHNVGVRFTPEDGHWKLRVEDDGCGMGFTGQMSSRELDAWSKCPLIIKERVRSIGGELIIQSVEGSGTAVEVLVPSQVYD